MSQVKAVNEYVLVKQDILQERVRGGIILPNTIQVKFVTGIVIAADETLAVKDGDKVVWAASQSPELEIGEDRLIVLQSKQIIAVLND